MDEDLKQLFLEKGLNADQVSAIQANDDTLLTVDDLASGAMTEADARSWAEELALTGRVPKSRFVQSWVEARSRLRMAIQIVAEQPQVRQAWEDNKPRPAHRPGAFSAAAGDRGLLKAGEDPPLLRMSSAPEEGPKRSILKFKDRQLGSSDFRESSPNMSRALSTESASSSIAVGRRISFKDPLAGDAAAGDGAPAPARQSSFGRRRTDPGLSGGWLDRDGSRAQARNLTSPTSPTTPNRRGFQELLSIGQSGIREQVVVPKPGQEETFPKPGGFSTELTKLLKHCGLTSLEVRDLEEHLEIRSCRNLAMTVHSEEQAMRLAETAGVRSKVSKEYFAEAWRMCADADDGRRRAVSVGGAFEALSLNGPMDFPLFTMMVRGDWDGCSNFLLRGGNLQRKEDLVHLLAALVSRLANKEEAAAREAGKIKSTDKVSAMLAKSYGEEAAHELDRAREAQQAEWRWRWTLRELFSARTALALQKRLLQDYKSVSFQVAAYELNKDWESRDQAPDLEEKMKEIQALCLDKVLSRVLPCYGFSPDEAGVAEMKASVSKHAKIHTEARQLQVEISAAIMEGFTL